jgi:hypothetical protein
LRGDDATDGMTAGQDDAAMVNFRGGAGGLTEGVKAGSLDQRAAAGWAPVCLGFLGKYGPALAANSFHTQKLTRLSGIFRTSFEAGGSEQDRRDGCAR